MNCLIRHIEYLTLHHDCVVIPGLGALVSRCVSSCYDESANMVSAPFKELSFNADIIYDDGLLASSIARSEKVSYADAVRIVADEIAAMKAQLSYDGEFSLGSLGRIVYRDGLVEFECNTDRYCLHDIELCPLTANEESVATAEENVVPMLSRFTSAASRIAASVAIIFIVGLTLFNPARVGEGVMKASFLPVISSVHNNEQDSNEQADEVLNTPTDKDSDSLEMIADDNLIAEELYSDAEVADIEAVSDFIEEDEPEQLEPNVANADYYLIVASLPSAELADRFISDNKLSGGNILYTDGRYRVWLKNGATYSEAMDNDILDRFPDAWVYRIK